MSEIRLSVIIPAYNEEERMGESLRRVVRYLRSQDYVSEIIIVDDGSVDRTAEVAREHLVEFRHKVIQMDRNRGKGNAVRVGMISGEGQYLLFSDADLSTPIGEVAQFMNHLENGYDVVIGSRALPLSNVEVHQNIIRESMGKIFNLLGRLLAFRGISDSQCGFKCFRKDAAQYLFSKQKIEGFGFDAELIYLAQKKGYKILEAPVTWRNSSNSRVSMCCDPVRMFWDLIRIRFLHWKDQ